MLQKLLDGDHPVLAALREQLSGLSVKERKLTGAGFFTEFATAATVNPVPLSAGQVRFGDVQATIRGLKHGAGFLLYVDQGLLHFLEGYSFEEPWPECIHEFFVEYTSPDRKAELAKLE